jgi:hypothetical protein
MADRESNVYDKGARYGVKRLNPPGQLAWVVNGLDPDLGFTSWLETQTAPFPGEPDRRCDTLACLESRSGSQLPWACLLEPQGQDDPDFLLRVLQYLLALARELRHGPHGQDRFRMMAGIINLTERRMAEALDWRPPGASGKGVFADLWVKDVYFESAEATLADIQDERLDRSVLIWVPAMLGAERAEIIGWWRTLAEAEKQDRLRADYAGLALVMAEKRGRKDLWTEGLEGFNVEKSIIVESWKAEGELRRARADIKDVLEKKFCVTLPAEVQTAISQQADPAILSQWLISAALATSLEEFRVKELPANGSSVPSPPASPG